MPSWNPGVTTYEMPSPLLPRTLKQRSQIVNLPEVWSISTVPVAPNRPRFLDVPSTFFSSAKEI